MSAAMMQRPASWSIVIWASALVDDDACRLVFDESAQALRGRAPHSPSLPLVLLRKRLVRLM